MEEITKPNVELEDPLSAFMDAKQVAEQAKTALAARYLAIQKEKKETMARLNAEAKKIRGLIGRPGRLAKAKPAKAPKKGKKGNGKAPETTGPVEAAEAPAAK